MKTKYLKSLAALLLLGTSAMAQLPVETQTFDLESIDRHKSWFFYTGFKNANGEIVVKMGKPNCNMETNFWTGTRTYKGVAWEFDELKFDQSLKYVGKETRKFETTMEALQYEPVFGKTFNPEMGSITDGGFVEGITPDYLGQIAVVPTIAITGFKVSSFAFYGKVRLPEKNQFACSEVVTAEKINVIPAKEEKGQKWYAQDYAHFPGGGDIIFATAGVYPEPKTAHYVLKRFDDQLNTTASLHIPFDYNMTFQFFPLDRGNGMKDYVMVCQSATKYGKDMPIKSSTHCEVVYIDGATFQIKYRVTTSLPYSLWNVQKVVQEGNDLYFLGAAGKDTKAMYETPGKLTISDAPMPRLKVNSSKVYPNYQVMKISNGQVAYVKGTSLAEATGVTTVLNGTKLKAKPSPIFTFPTASLKAANNSNLKAEIANGKIILSGQQLIKASTKGEDRGNMVTLIFNTDGSLQRYIIKPESTYSTSVLSFSKDKSTAYWSVFELGELNKLEMESGAGLTSKKVPSMIAGNLHLVRIDLNEAKASDIQVVGAGEFAISNSRPILVDADDEIVYMGRTYAKKAKDSELVLVKVKKQ